MKTLIFTKANESQTDLLIKLAQELHITVEVMDEEETERKALLKLSEKSFAEEWDSKEDEHWDEFLKTTKNVPTR